jgi:endogenous inhibitor of DNA gyrase (YacG/DUF329 family)
MADATTTGRCAHCGKPAEARFAPFCSARCQQVDLGHWLKGNYVIPGRPDEDRTGPDGPAQQSPEDEE